MRPGQAASQEVNRSQLKRRRHKKAAAAPTVNRIVLLVITGMSTDFMLLALSRVIEEPTIHPAITWIRVLYQEGRTVGPKPKKFPKIENSIAPTAIEPGKRALAPNQPPKMARAKKAKRLYCGMTTLGH
jgi:hypothetical protein